MPIRILDHPLAKDCLAKLRDVNTDHKSYKILSKPLAMLIALCATENLKTNRQSINTPLCKTTGELINNPIVLVPILRAGLSMLAPIQELFPDAKTGFIGLQRVDGNIEPEKYYFNVPKNSGATVLILDPMIATGGSACVAVEHLLKLEFTDIRILSFLAAPEGIKLLEAKHPEVTVYTASVDDKLDENNYIIPGLGDFGDRFFGTPHQKG